ncbi:hypothetical protein [Yunchengibacter salinarum]|uniref:hypothetical protein n=1 Tax=Yunchengibacter salinarum TaxID=3133399 RepID=UPI0035B5A409
MTDKEPKTAGAGRADRHMAAEARRPRPAFLVLALFASAGAVATYLFENALTDGGRALSTFLVLLVAFIVLALFFTLCYRVPRLGNRLLGYGAWLDQPKDPRAAGFTYGGGFGSETGLETKHLSTRRKTARAERRRMAETQRALDAHGTPAGGRQPGGNDDTDDDTKGA